jgi:hypothetical protein
MKANCHGRRNGSPSAHAAASSKRPNDMRAQDAISTSTQDGIFWTCRAVPRHYGVKRFAKFPALFRRRQALSLDWLQRSDLRRPFGLSAYQARLVVHLDSGRRRFDRIATGSRPLSYPISGRHDRQYCWDNDWARRHSTRATEVSGAVEAAPQTVQKKTSPPYRKRAAPGRRFLINHGKHRPPACAYGSDQPNGNIAVNARPPDEFAE